MELTRFGQITPSSFQLIDMMINIILFSMFTTSLCVNSAVSLTFWPFQVLLWVLYLELAWTCLETPLLASRPLCHCEAQAVLQDAWYALKTEKRVDITYPGSQQTKCFLVKFIMRIFNNNSIATAITLNNTKTLNLNHMLALELCSIPNSKVSL